jgi:hypothetical protein
MKIIKLDADVTSVLSFLLGKYQGLGLFKDYPNNFNEMMPQLADELMKAISVEIDADLHEIHSYCDCAFDEKSYCLRVPEKLMK